MATVQDLVEFLRDTADDLEINYNSSTPLKVSSNTYKMSQHILGTDEGFVDLDDPVDEDAEMEWPKPDEEEGEDEEMLEEKKGHPYLDTPVKKYRWNYSGKDSKDSDLALMDKMRRTPEGRKALKKTMTPPEERDECFLGLNEEDENLDEYGRSYKDVAEEDIDEGQYSDEIMRHIRAGHNAVADDDMTTATAILRWLWDHMGQMDSFERKQYETLKDIVYCPEEKSDLPKGFFDDPDFEEV